ncbi:MAG: hypothetical protein ACLFPF_09420 [Halanaerobiales bacterium]
MKCPECNETDIIHIYEEEAIKYKCINGHSWSENYSDQGGVHPRPDFYKVKLEEIFFEEEREIYEKLLEEMKESQGFYMSTDPEAQAKRLIEKCQISHVKLFQIIKRINDYYDKIDWD